MNIRSQDLSQDEIDLAYDSIKRKIESADPQKLDFQFNRLEIRVIGLGVQLVKHMVQGK